MQLVRTDVGQTSLDRSSRVLEALALSLVDRKDPGTSLLAANEAYQLKEMTSVVAEVVATLVLGIGRQSYLEDNGRRGILRFGYGMAACLM